MYVHRFNNGKRISQYTCSQYSKIPVGTLRKTQHRINESVVLELVKDLLKAIAEYAKHERAEFVRVVQEAQSSQQTAEVKKQRTRLATAKQRISELEVLLCKIYEDNILGKLSDSRYATLDAQYLQAHRPILFNELVLSDKLHEHCAEINEAAQNRMELIVPQLAKQYGATEQLNAENQMEWVRQMNACKAQAEAIVKFELIYD